MTEKPDRVGVSTASRSKPTTAQRRLADQTAGEFGVRLGEYLGIRQEEQGPLMHVWAAQPA